MPIWERSIHPIIQEENKQIHINHHIIILELYIHIYIFFTCFDNIYVFTVFLWVDCYLINYLPTIGPSYYYRYLLSSTYIRYLLFEWSYWLRTYWLSSITLQLSIVHLCIIYFVSRYLSLTCIQSNTNTYIHIHTYTYIW